LLRLLSPPKRNRRIRKRRRRKLAEPIMERRRKVGTARGTVEAEDKRKISSSLSLT
jgi:hypothetical protein